MTSPSWEVAPTMPVGLADYAPGADFGPRACRDHEFVWLLRGSTEWTVVGPPGDALEPATYRLRPGQLALARAGTIDSYRWDRRHASTHAYVHFVLPDTVDTDGWPRVRAIAAQPLLGSICDHLLTLGGSSSPDAREQSDRLVGVLLELFVAGPLEASGTEMPEAVAQLIAAVREIWRRDGLRLIGTAELAAATHLSTGHVFRLFRQTYGCGPAHALELVRLSRAAVALQRSNATLAEVARTAGFANPYHLSRRFSAAYGSPPGAYRALQAGDPLAPIRTAHLLPVAYALLG